MMSRIRVCRIVDPLRDPWASLCAAMQISASLHREPSKPDVRRPRYDERKRRRRAVGLETQDRRDDDVGQAGDLATEQLGRRLGVAAGRQTAQGIGDEGTLAHELRGLRLELPLVAHVTGHVDVPVIEPSAAQIGEVTELTR